MDSTTPRLICIPPHPSTSVTQLSRVWTQLSFLHNRRFSLLLGISFILVFISSSDLGECFLICFQKNKSIIIVCIKSAEIDLSRIDAKNSDFSYRIQFLIIKKRILFVYFENMCSENSTRPPCRVFQQKNIILFDKTN